MPSNRMSIIIPVYNQFAFTENALKDLSFLDPSMHQIIIADNCSTDQTSTEITNKWVKKLSNLKYMRFPENFGFGKACNLAFKESSGNMVMFLNNDIRVASGRQMTTWTDSFFEELQSDTEQLISPTAGFVDPKKDFSFSYETSELNKEFNYLSGWMLVGLKKTFGKLTMPGCSGPFNEKFFAYFEDTDLSWRAKKLGIKLQLSPQNNVIHFGKVTSRSLNTNQLYVASKKIFSLEWKDKLNKEIIK